MKKMPAFLAALVMTLCVGGIMVALGINALLNPTSVQVLDNPGLSQEQVANVSGGSDAQAQAAIQQLQARVQEYQAREKQYQDQLSQAQQQISQANDQLSQYQSLVERLTEMGIIRIDRRGQIQVSRGFSDHDD